MEETVNRLILSDIDTKGSLLTGGERHPISSLDFKHRERFVIPSDCHMCLLCEMRRLGLEPRT